MKTLAVAIAAVTMLRLVMAAVVPLAPDEAYYWIWSRALAPGYLDHPPMVALWIRAGTSLLGQTALGVRLSGPLAAALASWMLFDAARVLFPGTKAGLAAVSMLNASLLLGVGTVIMTPDSPLLFFWTATFWAAARIAAGGLGTWWVVAGVAGGLALDSKYTALFAWVGIGLWAWLVPALRPWLWRWQPWAAVAAGLALFAPVLVWNVEHDWAGFARQGGRLDAWQPARAMTFLAELLGGQIGLVTPLIWILCMVGLVVAVRHALRLRDPRWTLLVALSLPPILVFLQHAIGDRVQGNWPAIIYPALVVAAGAATWRKRWWIGGSALGVAMTAVTYLQATTALIPLPPRLNPITARLVGWGQLAAQVETARQEAGATFVAADRYALTSELTWWLPAGVVVVGTDTRWSLLALPRTTMQGQVGLLARDSRRNDLPDPALWISAEPVGAALRPGSGAGEFMLYRVIPRPGTEAVELMR